MENCVSVTQLNKYIKSIFDSEVMLQNISVFGEVGNYSLSNGIAYFNLKDVDNLLPCVLFGAGKFAQPKIGDMVLLTGSMSYYSKGGKLSFNATKMMPYGKGLLYEKFLQLKEELEKKGYFDVSAKKPIPKRVKRIGVVTSSTGAVIQDIIDVTTRRNDSIDIVLYPVKVQGVGAEFEIANGIKFFSDYDNVDVVIVARGGGSLEDLQPFNTEVVAEAVWKCDKPLVSAVGHETDYTIIDFVADMRAPTPSAAAELVAWRKDLLLQGIKDNLSVMERYLLHVTTKYVASIDKYLTNIHHNLVNKLNSQFVNVASLYGNACVVLDKKLADYENKINILNNTMQTLNPLNLTAKGFVKIFKNNKKIISVNDLDVNDNIEFDLCDGKISSNVTQVTKRRK